MGITFRFLRSRPDSRSRNEPRQARRAPWRRDKGRESVRTEYFPEHAESLVQKVRGAGPFTSERKSEKVFFRSGSLNKAQSGQRRPNAWDYANFKRDSPDHTQFNFGQMAKPENGSSLLAQVSAREKSACHSDSTRKSEVLFERIDSPKTGSAEPRPSSLKNHLKFLDRKMLAAEIGFVYAHELNKLLFSLETVREVFDYLHGHSICRVTLTLGFLILRRTKARLKIRAGDIVHRRNCFGLQRFAEFLETPRYEQVFSKFKRVLRLTRLMEKALRRTRRFQFFVELYRLDKVLVAEASESEFERALALQLSQLTQSKLKAKGHPRKGLSERYRGFSGSE